VGARSVTTTAAKRGPLTTAVGGGPLYEAIDSNTGTLYVANTSDGTLSMIDTRTCNVERPAGCARKWPTVKAGSADGQAPFGVAVDEANHTVYATDFGNARVTLFDATTCNATRRTGCRAHQASVPVGTAPNEANVDPSTNVVYVTNSMSGSFSVIDGNACNAARPSCHGQPFTTVKAGGGAGGVHLDPATHTVYVVNYGHNGNPTVLPGANTLSVVNAATCTPTSKAGGAPFASIKVGPAPADLTIDPATDTLYVTNTYDYTGQTNGTVSVVNARLCNATQRTGCHKLRPPQVPMQSDPDEQWFDQTTGLVWITNQKSDTVSVIDTHRCSAANLAGCANVKPRTIALTPGSSPDAVIADPATRSVYVVDNGSNDVTVLPER
jgi:DNA-binding beta-propeller fold protein YncE